MLCHFPLSWDHLPNKLLTLKSLSQDLLLRDSNLSHFLFKYGCFRTVVTTSFLLPSCLFQPGVPSTPLLASPLGHDPGPYRSSLGLMNIAQLLRATVHSFGMEIFPPCNTGVLSFLSDASPAVGLLLVTASPPLLTWLKPIAEAMAHLSSPLKFVCNRTVRYFFCPTQPTQMDNPFIANVSSLKRGTLLSMAYPIQLEYFSIKGDHFTLPKFR